VDPIDRLAARLASTPLWNNGLSPQIDLPPTAATDEVVAAVFERVSFDQGRATRHETLRTKPVSIGGDPREYVAVLVETNFGRKIVLLRYEGQSIGWWSRVFDEAEAP
jgi:hypothetical protein